MANTFRKKMLLENRSLERKKKWKGIGRKFHKHKILKKNSLNYTMDYWIK